MTEKQFSIVGKEYVSYYCGYAQIISNGTLNFSVWESEEDAQKVCDSLNEQQARIKKLEKEKTELLKKIFFFEKGITFYLQKEEQMDLYTYVDLEMKRWRFDNE